MNSKYEDNIISFEYPDNFQQYAVKRKSFDHWNVTGYKVDVDIVISYGGNKWTFFDALLALGVQQPQGMSGEKISPIFESSSINGNKTYYSTLSSPCSDDREYTTKISVIETDCIINVIVRQIGKKFCFDTYTCFLSSISVDTQNLHEAFCIDRGDIVREIDKNLSETIPLDIPTGFKYKIKKPMEDVVLIKQGMTISVGDGSILGLEADIDLFTEEQKRGIKRNDVALLTINGKKCLVQNMLENSIDLANSQKIYAVLAFGESCYVINFDSDAPFDLTLFYSFIDSIGKKA